MAKPVFQYAAKGDKKQFVKAEIHPVTKAEVELIQTAPDEFRVIRYDAKGKVEISEDRDSIAKARRQFWELTHTR